MADAPVSEIVQLSITQDNVVIQRANYGTPLILSPNAVWAERARSYSGIAAVAVDWPATSPEYLAANGIFSQNPCPPVIYIGRAVGKPTLAYQLNVTTVATGSNYAVTVLGQGVTTTSFSYVPKADVASTFLPRVSNVLTSVAHGMITGEGPYRFSNSGGALPTGLAIDTNYWIIANTVDTFSLATSKANAIALTAIALSTDGTGTQTLRRTENDVICAQIVQGLNAVVGANYVAAQVTGAGETDYVTVTANTAGGYFAIQTPASLVQSVMTHTSTTPSVATDLTAINAEQPNWYVLYTLYNSDAYVKDAAAWVESNGKIYIADLVASQSATLAAGGSDTMQALATSAYTRTAVLWHPLPSEMNGAAWMGDRLTDDPGGNTWKFSKLAGVDPVDTTGTWRTNIRAKNGNVYIKTSGLAIMVEGTMANGGFIDTRRGLDFLQDDASKSVYEVLAGARRIPFTDGGIALIVNALRGSLKRCFGMGIINADFAITFPKARDVSSVNRGLRVCPDIKFTCTLQGAIHKVIISGVVSV